MILACPGSRAGLAVLQSWGRGDPLGRRVPRDRTAPRGRPDQLDARARLDLEDPQAPVAPPEVRVPLASEAPLGKMARVGRRAQLEKTGAQDRLGPGVTLVLPGSRGPLGRGRTGSRASVDRQDRLGPWEPRASEALLGFRALPAAAVTQASGSPVLLARPDHLETKAPRARAAPPAPPAPRDPPARTARPETPGRGAPPAGRASLRRCLPRTSVSW